LRRWADRGTVEFGKRAEFRIRCGTKKSRGSAMEQFSEMEARDRGIVRRGGGGI